MKLAIVCTCEICGNTGNFREIAFCERLPAPSFKFNVGDPAFFGAFACEIVARKYRRRGKKHCSSYFVKITRALKPWYFEDRVGPVGRKVYVSESDLRTVEDDD